MKPVKILYLITTVEEGKGIGGAEKLLLSMLDKIDKKRFIFHIAYHIPARLKKITERTKVEQLFRGKGAEVELFETRSKFDLFAAKRLVTLIRRKDIDVVHSHQPRVDFLGTLAGKLSGIPIIVTRHLSIARFPINRVRKRIYRLFDSIITARLADIIVAVSKEIASDLIEVEKVKPKKVKVIYNGIDSEAFNIDINQDKGIRREFGLGALPVVGVIARINVQKGHKYFLEAAAQVIKVMPEVKFLVVGDGPLKEEIEKLSKKLGLDKNVIFTGYRVDIPQILSELDIVVLSSLTEGLPVIILEAMAAGKPVVSFNVGGVSEVIDDNNTGLLIEARNTYALAEGMIELLKDKKKSKMMAAAARMRVKKEFSLENMTRQYEEIYSRVT